MREIEQGRLTPALGGALVVGSEDGLLWRMGSNASAKHCLNAIDESSLDHGIALVHPECDRLPEELIFGGLAIAFEKSQVANETLTYDRIGEVKAEGAGLLEPERIFDDLVLDGAQFGDAWFAPQLVLIGSDSFIDFAAQNLDHDRFRIRRPQALEAKEQRPEEQKVDER